MRNETHVAIVAYDFRGDRYLPNEIIDALPTGPGEQFDGWALAPPIHMTVEDNLDEMAHAFGINREDESSFDQNDFPKRVLALTFDPPEVRSGVNVALILEVIRRINEEPRHFDMTAWITKRVTTSHGYVLEVDPELSDVTNPKCGTTMCGAGWVLASTGKIEDQEALITNLNSEVVPRALTALGLSFEYEALFYMNQWPGADITDGDPLPRDEQVRELTRLLSAIAIGEKPWGEF